MKRYPCVPGASVLIPFFALSAVFYLQLAYMSCVKAEVGPMIFFVLFALICVALVVWLWDRSLRKVQIEEKAVVCKAPLCKNIIIEYEKCTIGMEYHFQRGSKVWWIYLCYGKPPKWDSKKTYNRINSEKCRQGFIRIMYQREIYESLLQVLPKRQRTALESAYRFTGIV